MSTTYAIQANVYGTIDNEYHQDAIVIFRNAGITKPTSSWKNIGDGILRTIAPASESGNFECPPLPFVENTVFDPSWEFEIIRYDDEGYEEVIGTASANYRKIIKP